VNTCKATEGGATHILVASPAKNVQLVRNSGYEVGPACSEPRVLRVVRHQVVLETKIGVHADDCRIQVPSSIVGKALVSAMAQILT